MEKDQKRALFFFSIIAIIALFWIGYILLNNVIGKGRIEVVGQAPFTVTLPRGEPISCQVSPCSIPANRGSVDVLISKEGYRGVYQEVMVPFRGTAKIEAVFKIIPSVSETDQFPIDQETIEYQVVEDQDNGEYKLVKAGDPTQTALAYFQRKIDSPKIIGSNNSVLVIDQSERGFVGYRVDLRDNSRSLISDAGLGRVKAGKWSFSGDYLILQSLDFDNLMMIGPDNQIKGTNLITDIRQVAWKDQDELVFATNQGFEDGGPSTEFLDYYSLGIFTPAENLYTLFYELQGFDQVPKELIALKNGKELYFEFGNKKFKISLE